ncbi:MAG: hypothetical protein Q8O72_02000 [Bacteroidales bacterium]|nr:hypothetical protein [Bacteroidales bacterium]
MYCLKTLIAKHIQGRKVFIFFILTNLIYAFMLVVTIPMTLAYAPDSKLLDMMPAGYNLKDVTDLFAALGAEGRHTYLFYQIPVDMVYPMLFAIGYCLLMAYFLNKLGKLRSPYFYLALLPLVAGAADYLENMGFITLLNQYPDINPTLVKISGVFSVIKSSSTTIYFISLIVVLTAFLIQILSKKKAKKILPEV